MIAKKKLILVGWDGADWKVANPLMDAGKMPQLNNIAENGVVGRLSSYPPYLSPMLWNTISTGKGPAKHGIAGFAEVDPTNGRVRPASSRSRRCKAIWNMLSESGHRCHVLGWFASHPAEAINGVCVSEAYARPSGKIGGEWALPNASVFPSHRSTKLEKFRVAPEEIDPAILQFLIPRYPELSPPLDRYAKLLTVRLSELYSIHNAAVHLVQTDPDFQFCAVYYHFLDWVSHDFMEFHPPRREHIDSERYEFFKDVVNNSYQLQDLLLRDLLASAGENTTVMVASDHGFHSDDQRPVETPKVTAGIAAWHRPYGVIAMAGSGVCRDTIVTGASLSDITPSVLHYFDLPIGKDMDGRVLGDMFLSQRLPHYIESWETREPRHSVNREHLEKWDNEDETALLKHFAQLGYLSADVGEFGNADKTRSENAWNLGVALRSENLPADALPHLEEAYFHAPEQPHIANQLAHCQLSLGLFDEAEETIETILDYGFDRPRANLVMATIEYHRGNYSAAWNRLEQAENLEEGRGQLALRRGMVLLALEQHDQALKAFEKALEFNRDDPSSHLGRARALLGLGNNQVAMESATDAVALDYDNSECHLVLALANENLGNWRQAQISYETALSITPGDTAILHRLAEVSRHVLDKTEHFQSTERKPDRQKNSDRLDLNAIRSASVDRFHRWTAQRDARRHSQRPAAVLGRAKLPEKSGKVFCIVSGLPRSGTSLLMQMLKAGGLEPMSDNERVPDENNPEGYLEWEAIKALPSNPELILEAEGKVAKVVLPLLPSLPRIHRYKIILMERELLEVAVSQNAMLRSSGKPELPLDETMRILSEYNLAITTQIQSWPHFDYLPISFNSLVTTDNPRHIVDRIVNFLGEECLPRAHDMAGAIRRDLYRHRGTGRE